MRLIVLAAAIATLLVGATAAPAQEQKPSAADIIKLLDQVGDGVVTKDERIAAGRPAKRFDIVDANHDGKITADEFAAAMRKQQSGQ